MTYMVFEKKLIRKLTEDGYDYIFMNQGLMIYNDQSEVGINIKSIYSDFINRNKLDFIDVYKKICEELNKEKNKINLKVDWDNVYPIIRTKDLKELERYFSYDMYSVFDLYLVENIDENKQRWLRNIHVKDVEGCVKKAFENLGKVDVITNLLQDDMKIFGAIQPLGFKGTLGIQKNVQKYLYEKLGDGYLILFYEDGFFVATEDTDSNYKVMLKQIEDTMSKPKQYLSSGIELDRIADGLITKKLYRSFNVNEYDYANRKDILKVVK